MDSFKDRLVFAMDQRGLRQVDLVNKTGIKKSTISYYVTGRNIPNAENIRKLAIALSVKEDWLLGYDVKMDRQITASEADDIINTIRSLSPDSQRLLFSLLRTLKNTDKKETDL